MFGDEQAVSDLNAIVHPAVRAEIARRVAANADTDKVVVLDIPLITDRAIYGWLRWSSSTFRPSGGAAGRRRPGDERGPGAGADRPAVPRERRLAMADRVIDNCGDRAALERQVDDVWSWMHTLPPQRS